MKRLLYTLLLGLVPWLASAQSFTFSQSVAIADDSAEVCLPLTVSGLPTRIDSAFGLKSVQVNITHSYDGDLRIRLRGPNGAYIVLIDRRGGSGDNFVGTTLQMNAPRAISTGGAPFTGPFLPEQSLNTYNQGINPNGVWSLCVEDLLNGDSGFLNNFTLTFGANPPQDPPLPPMPCSATNPAGCHCADSLTAVCDLLPDMIATADIIAQQHTETPGRITLGNATPNVGWGPMEIHGSGQCYCDSVLVNCATTLCPNGMPPKEKVLQRIYRKNGNVMTTSDRPAGYMSFHPSHGHVHVDNWSSFTLRTSTSNPDPSTWPIVGTGSKISFCLVNVGTCDRNPAYCRDGSGQIIPPSRIQNSGFGTVSGCGRDQGIFVGSYDVYGQGLAGMYIDVPPGTCNGNYYLVSITDPDNNFLESDETNNAVAVPITLTRQITRATPAFSYSQLGGQFAFSGSGVPAGSTFSWNFNDGSPLDVTNNPTIHAFASPGPHTVTFTVTSPCGADSVSRTFTVLSTGKDTEAPAYALRAVPNPTSGTAALRFALPAALTASVDAYNVLGQRVRHLDLGLRPAGEQTVNLDLGGELPAGVYLVWLRTEQGIQAVRVVKE